MITNLWKRLRNLLPEPPLLAGEVVAAGTYSVTVELPDGSRITARGSASVGQHVFVRDGRVEGIAPALTVVDIDV